MNRNDIFNCPLSLWNNPHIAKEYVDEEKSNDKSYCISRQFFHTTLSERINTRPSLSDVEKRWITYQLLKYMVICEDTGFFHGNLSCRNVVLTSWNWVYLVDQGYPFRPVYISKQKQDFLKFYHTDVEVHDKDCYVAPERIGDYTEHFDVHKEYGRKLRDMDIFSLGCILYVLWTGSRALFDYDDMLEPERYHKKINNVEALGDMGAMISKMVSFSPDARPSAHECLVEFKSLFPEYLELLHVYVILLNLKGIDARVNDIYRFMNEHGDDLNLWSHLQGLLKGNWTNQLIADLDGYEDIKLDDQGCVILLNILCSSIRHLKQHELTIRCLKCISINVSHERFDDRIKLQYILPNIANTLKLYHHPSAIVRAYVIRLMAQVLNQVKTIPESDIYIFQEYLVPIYNYIIQTEKEDIVFQALADTLPQLYLAAEKFYTDGTKLIENLPKDGKIIAHGVRAMKDNYKKVFKDISIKLLKNQESPQVKISVLSHILELCKLFAANDPDNSFLKITFTCLTSKDMAVKLTAICSVVNICKFFSPNLTVNYVWKYLVPLLYDEEEAVVEACLLSLASLCSLNIYSKHVMLNLCILGSSLLLHPNAWIRFGITSLILSVEKSTCLSEVDKQCFLIPIVRSFLTTDICEINEDVLTLLAISPISRSAYDLTIKSFSLSDSGINGRAFEQEMTQSDSQSSHIQDSDQTIEDTSPISKRSLNQYDSINVLDTDAEEIDYDHELFALKKDTKFKFALSGLDIEDTDAPKLYLMKDYIQRVSRIESVLTDYLNFYCNK